MTLGELGGAPAADGMTDKLTRRNEPGEADENDDGVESRQPIHVIVIGAELDFFDAQQRLWESIHYAGP